MTEESVHFHVGDVRLEGRLAVPAGAARGAVVCHPHPQYGGTMDNNVVVAVCDALQAAGVATLRFNFRGVAGSQGSYTDGRGEVDDTRQAVAFLRERLGNGDVTLVGYSFGAMMALLAGHDASDVSRLVAIAPPVAMFDLAFLKGCERPKLVVAGDRDQYCPLAELEAQLAKVAEPKSFVRIAGADHFFYGHEAATADAVAKFIGGEAVKMSNLRVGLSREERFAVTHEITAAAMFEVVPLEVPNMPEVWSTPDMIGKMEAVAAAVAAACLPEGQITVGARNDVRHFAATPVGMAVRVKATLTALEGRKLTFAVEAHDEKEKVGEGVHIRYIVDHAEFHKRLAEKAGT